MARTIATGSERKLLRTAARDAALALPPLAVGLVYSGGALTQGLPADEAIVEIESETFRPARAIERTAPIFPALAARRGQEGWVMLSYVVGKDGKISEAMIEDSSGEELFERLKDSKVAARSGAH